MITAKARSDEDLRRKMLQAKHGLEMAADAALREADLWAFDSLIRAPDMPHGPCFRGEYHVTGHSDALAVVIYGKPGIDPASDPACTRALATLKAALPDHEIRFAQPNDYALCWVDCRKVTW